MWGPHRRGRIPVVFVHGTASSVARWAEMINEFDSDPAIRQHYEFWFFTYPTGNPILYSANLLRVWLTRVVDQLDPKGEDPALSRMVIMGHSQGGLLTKLQVISSGTQFWDAISKTPFEKADLRPETRDLLGKALFFEPLPFVRRVIFVSTPQRGSFVAANWMGRLATRLTQAPGRLVGLPLDLARAGIALPGQAVDLVQGDVDELRVQRALSRLPSSVDNMNPSSTFIQALSNIRVEPPVVAHSIIPVTGPPPPDGQNDGVVEFSSASIEEARSELVVFNQGHSVQSHPKAIEEVRRILLEHLAEQD
jgi:pimeloyl-ACP methyl ester carboxylesterase